jgi:Ser/Thr protein kinase RdoA (MazF antagonist)
MPTGPPFERHPFGFTSECFTDGVQLLKVWREGAPPTDLALLKRLAAAGLPVPVALASGTVGGWPWAVFPFVVGRHATDGDCAVVARALRRVHDTPTAGLALRERDLAEECVVGMRSRLDHPWLSGRRDEVARTVNRLEAAIEASDRIDVPLVLCHNDFGGWNLLVDQDTCEINAMLDWDYAALAPREDDVWVAFRFPDPLAFLDAYGRDAGPTLDRTHMERALLARAVRDAWARLCQEVDREGVDLWGFDQWRKIDDQLALLDAWCSRS